MVLINGDAAIAVGLQVPLAMDGIIRLVRTDTDEIGIGATETRARTILRRDRFDNHLTFIVPQRKSATRRTIPSDHGERCRRRHVHHQVALVH